MVLGSHSTAPMGSSSDVNALLKGSGRRKPTQTLVGNHFNNEENLNIKKCFYVAVHTSVRICIATAAAVCKL